MFDLNAITITENGKTYMFVGIYSGCRNNVYKREVFKETASRIVDCYGTEFNKKTMREVGAAHKYRVQRIETYGAWLEFLKNEKQRMKNRYDQDVEKASQRVEEVKAAYEKLLAETAQMKAALEAEIALFVPGYTGSSS